MFCPNCGSQMVDDSAQFCTKCGTKLTPEPITKTSTDEAAIEKPVEEASRTTNRSKLNRSALLWPIAVPVLSLIIGGSSVFAFYHHEVQTNKNVTSLKEQAEKSALKGDYTAALSSLKKAETERPSYQVLNRDEATIKQAIDLKKALGSISNSLKYQKLDEADSEISKFKDSLKNLKGPLLTSFQKQIEEKSTILAVAKIKVDINNIKTVDKLADKLSALSSLSSAETEEVKRLILEKIVDLSTKDAESKLGSKQFTEATTTIDKGLEYATDDKKLLAFKDRIQKEQSAFEKAEQARIQKAMEVAAQEDLKNHTAAISVDNLNENIDEYGDLHITGDILNKATVPVSSIEIYYTVYDVNGNAIGSDYTFADPYYLDVGQNGSFTANHYGVNQEVTVQVTKVTWELN